jgi:hypothetical protein
MYMGCNGATCVYMSCLTKSTHIHKSLNFLLLNEKNGGFETTEGNGRPSKQDA